MVSILLIMNVDVAVICTISGPWLCRLFGVRDSESALDNKLSASSRPASSPIKKYFPCMSKIVNVVYFLVCSNLTRSLQNGRNV